MLKNEGNKTHNFAELVITSCSFTILKYTHTHTHSVTVFWISIVQAEEENVDI